MLILPKYERTKHIASSIALTARDTGLESSFADLTKSLLTFSKKIFMNKPLLFQRAAAVKKQNGGERSHRQKSQGLNSGMQTPNRRCEEGSVRSCGNSPSAGHSVKTHTLVILLCSNNFIICRLYYTFPHLSTITPACGLHPLGGDSPLTVPL